MKRGKKVIVVIAAVSVMIWISAAVKIEAKEVYPAKPITIIVPFAPGGSMDVAARQLAIYMGKYLNTSMIISNIPGAGGAIGNTKGYTAKPDGYTLLVWYTMPPLLEEYRKKVGYETLKYTPIAGIAIDYAILVGNAEGHKGVLDYVKQAKEQNINIGSNGQYSITGLQARLMAQELGMKVNWVNFGGAAESLTSLAGKHIDAVATMTDSARPLLRAGKIIPLLIYAKKRLSKFLEVPVPDELGLKIPLINSYLGLVAPPGLDKEKVKVLGEAVRNAVQHPDYVAWREKVSTAEPAFMPADQYKIEIERFAKIAEKYKSVLNTSN